MKIANHVFPCLNQIVVLALVAIAACSLDVIPHYSHHGHGHGISTRYFRKAQGHGYGGLGYGGYGYGGLGYGGYIPRDMVV
ncbi:hypothetical protein AVEN_50943-1 [Araneus ventricosus]|uniref:Uncharacterized protein n=1 Tax=Araneus ventricosus TaxID=182803 RepID=A0A4Y2LCN7_ARAVE|nr:hypothetical protein AVEN_50943-1 [Araneus ventricosus]